MAGYGSILAVYNVNLKTRGHLGVMRKVLAQAQGFSLNHKQVHMICGDGPDIVRLVFEAGNKVKRELIIAGVAPGDFFVHVAEWIAGQQAVARSFEWAYVRYNPMHNDELVQLARLLREMAVPLFIEMYTLEYQNELPAFMAKTDQVFFLQLAPLVTGFFTPSRVAPGATLQGRPLCKMGNGATWIEPQAPEPKQDIRKAFHLLGVGYLARWHGYDRLFPLIPDFVKAYPDVDLQLFLVGQGPASAQLAQQAQELGVTEYVTFTGALDPQLLANRYASVHLGLGTLGCHRTGIAYAEALKHREFMFYGLPFIYSLQDSFSDDQLEGAWRQSADESPINLITIYEQYIAQVQDNISTQLVKYAKSNFTWQMQTKSIMNEVQKQLNNGDI
ncbi:glycosyltransferase [Aeromonas dhakensis]|uniref:glycosyltransferase n=1 Tax=Aeromonas dhakensis TaxID=196024 RepID=UPI0028DAA542|nr:glycosyltransferase [Aeromonas dhakensis]